MKQIGLITLLFITSALFAHEGMWIPSLLKINEGHMQSEGLKLTAEDIYSINNSSLKDAIALFGGGCTAEVISDQGLILTNHHCGYGAIRSHSTVDNDILKNGFWAEGRSAELINPNLSVTFVSRIEDVSKKILAGTADLDEEVLADTIAARSARLQSLVGEEHGIRGTVKPFYYGNEYYLIVTKTYSDVRLVGAPPSSIGKYGGDTDNWVWPRHNADFSLFRIYASQDNEPSEPDESNVPFKPAQHLKISTAGANEGDFAMIYGFPARTSTYLPSYAVEHIVEVENPAKIRMRSKSLDVLKPAMNNDPLTKIQYASKQSGISNAYKKWIGQNQGLRELGAVQKKMELEKALFARIGQSPELAGEKEGLMALKDAFSEYNKLSFARAVFIEMVYYGPDIIRFSRRFGGLANKFEELKASGELEAEIKKLKESLPKFFKDHNMQIEQEMLTALLPIYSQYARGEYQPKVITDDSQTIEEDATAYVSEVFSRTIFTDMDALNKLLDGFNQGKAKKIQKDLLFRFQSDLFDTYLHKVRSAYVESREKTEAGMRDLVKTRMILFPGETYWSDANSTLRLSYGRVEGSAPRDGMEYKHFTTLDGVVQKYIPADPEFDLPEKLIDLWKIKDYGDYADKDGTVHVCFTSSLHTTGGNSGSPVLNASGELIGLNFDRSWESTMSDLMFDPSRCRNISVDIRYILFIMDKFAGARHLIEELDLVQPAPIPATGEFKTEKTD